jgi:hypothetical protein
MKRLHWLLVVIGFGIVGLTGYWLGLLSGADFGVAFENAMRGSSSIDSLELIRKGKIASRSVVWESDIDNALYINHMLENHPAFRFLPSPWGHDIEAYRRKTLTRLADYRKEHPSPMSPEAFAAIIVDSSLRQSNVETQEIIGDMVKRYASKSP